MLFDDVPAIEISNANMGINTVARLMALRDTAVSMVDSCHLAELKSYTGRFSPSVIPSTKSLRCQAK